MNKILTIVIPSYNVSTYIEQCLDSLVKKPLKELEVLVIDDGSKDDTLEKAKKYEANYPDIIKAVHKENGGHGSAINKGLELATGKYFRILDGDDWVDWDSLVSLMGILKKSQSDMVLSDIVQVFSDRTNTQKFFKNLERGKIYELDKLSEIDYLTMGSVAIKTELLRQNGVHITENCYYVDIEYNSYCIAYSNTIQFEDLPFYMYRCGNVSQSTAKLIMFKNIEMLKNVSLGMIHFYDSLKLKNNGRKKLLLLRIGKLVRTTMLLFLANENTKSGFNGWKLYRESVENASKELYEYVIKKWLVVRVECFGSRTLFNVLSRLYKMREMCKKK